MIKLRSNHMITNQNGTKKITTIASGCVNKVSDNKGLYQTTSYTQGMHPTGLRNTNMGGPSVYGTDLVPLLDGVLPDYDNDLTEQLARIYRDMYYYDSIAGSAVDLLSTMPFSDYTISGVDDAERKAVYEDSLSQLNIETLMPQLSVDYLVTGAFIGIMVFNKAKGTFTDIMPILPHNCTFTDTPMYNQDPIIELKVPPDLKDFLNTKNELQSSLRDNMSESMIEKLRKGRFELDPLITLYLPRRTFATNNLGISYYKRILPIYLIEKNLWKGTAIESSRRQRSIMHIQAGDGEWEPTNEQLQFLTELFLNADADPVGAMVATRSGINVSDVRCLGGNSLIHTDKGLIPIKDLVEHDPNKLHEGSRVNANFNVKNHLGQYVPVKYWWYQGIKRLYTLTFDSGIVIEATKNHKFLTIGSGCGPELVKVSEITKDTWLLSDTSKTIFYYHDVNDNISNTNKFGIPVDIIITELKKHNIHKSLFRHDDGSIVKSDFGGLKTLFKPFMNESYFLYSKYEAGYYDEILGNIKGISLNLYKNIVNLFKQKYKFEHVTITKSIKDHVYDLTIDPKYSKPFFVVNGIISKNSGGDFWNVYNFYNDTTPLKMRSLGISDSFLSSEASWQKIDASMSVFMNTIRNYRDMLTREIIYKKIFPLISLANGFGSDPNITLPDISAFKDVGAALKAVNDKGRLLIPTLDWTKSLQPEGDPEYLSLLETMTEAGVPVSIRAYAAAGGMDIDKLMDGFDEDIEHHKKIAEYNDSIKRFKPTDELSSAMLDDANIVANNNPYSSGVWNAKGKMHPLSRDYGDMSEIRGSTKTGKESLIVDQKNANDRANKLIQKAVKKVHNSVDNKL